MSFAPNNRTKPTFGHTLDAGTVNTIWITGDDVHDEYEGCRRTDVSRMRSKVHCYIVTDDERYFV